MKLDTVCMYELKSGIGRLATKFKNVQRIRNTKRKNVKDEDLPHVVAEETAKEVSNLRAIVLDVKMAREELMLVSEEEMPSHFFLMLKNMDRHLNVLNMDTFTFESAAPAFEAIAEFEQVFFAGLAQSYNYSYLLVVNTHKQASSAHVVGQMLPITEEPLNFIANVKRQLATQFEYLPEGKNVVTHAYAINEEDEALYAFDKKAIGDVSFISHDSFDVAYLDIPFDLGRKDSDTPMNNKNYNSLVSITRYIRSDGGYLVFSIPYYRLSSAMASFLLRNYDEISIYNTDQGGSVDSADRLIVARRAKKDSFEPIMKPVALRRILFQDDLLSNESIKELTLPEKRLRVDSFRGAVISRTDAVNFINSSKSAYALMEADQNDDGVVSETTPLLPFSTGQVGMVLTGGYLNGIVDEGDGYKHLVKGRVINRETSTRKIDEEGSETVQTISSSSVQIHTILPDGTNKQFI